MFLSQEQQLILMQYQENQGEYQIAGDELVKKLTKVFDDSDLHIHTISGRLKEFGSLERKVQAKAYTSLSEVTDLLGVRVIGYFRNEIEYACQLIADSCDVDIPNSGSRGASEPDRFGYQSMHFVVRVGVLELTPNPIPIHAEIQVRTILQHAWAEIEHGLNYKSEAELPDEIRRSLYRSAAVLEGSDIEFVRNRKAIVEYQRNLMPLGIQPTLEDQALSIDSLRTLLFESRVVSCLDQAIAKTTGAYIHFSQDTVETLVEKLRGVGILTTRGLESLLYDRAQDVLDHYKVLNNRWRKRMGTFPEKHGDNSCPRGTCATYLYFLLSGKGSLAD